MSEQNAPGAGVTIYQALHQVMDEIKAVGKEGKNAYDGYNFRGIDGVMNAVGPALRRHGVIAVPRVEDIHYEKVPSKNGSMMTSVRLQMRVEWWGPGGDHLDTVVWGEAFDRGDKATAKAHSVAFRTAMLQTLCLPTQEPDPDEFSYEQRDLGKVREEILAAYEKARTTDELREVWRQASEAGVLDDDVNALITSKVKALQEAADGSASAA